MQKFLIDTDVIIDYLRGNKHALTFFETLENTPILISVISIAELFSGVRDNHEKEILDNFLKHFETVVITTEIAQQGGLIKRDYGKKIGTGLADAIIAASALKHNATLVTLNTKHFKMLSDSLAPYKK